MDTFLNEVNVSLFKEWILNQYNSHAHINLSYENDNFISLKTDQCISSIVFHPKNIIELSIKNIQTNEIIFYLHFQMTSMKHAIDLFNEMIDTLLNFKETKTKKVLICCSGGLTSAYFVSKIKEAIKVISSDYSFESVSYTKIHELAPLYDIILLAPQISYNHTKIKELIHNKLILNIPPNIFAKYDVGKLLSFINNEYNSYLNKINPIKQNISNSLIDIDLKDTLLCINIFNKANKSYMSKTIYKNSINYNDDINMKNTFGLSDIINVIDSTISYHNDLRQVNISLPGYIKNNIIYTSLSNLNNFNLLEYLKNKYSKISFFIEPYTHTIAKGYHYINKDTSMVYLFKQNDNFQSVFIYNDILINNDKYACGDLNYMPITNDYSTNQFYFQDTKLIKTIVSIICLLAPDKIILNEDFPYSSQIIKEELSHYLPQDYIPIIEKSTKDVEYLYIGQIIKANKKK